MKEGKLKHFWTCCPDRDEVLDRIADFVNVLAAKKAGHLTDHVVMRSPDLFQQRIAEYIGEYAGFYMEDEELKAIGAPLHQMIDDPEEVDENQSEPSFSGNAMQVQPNEIISIGIAFMGRITNLRFSFKVEKVREVYVLTFHKIIKL